MFCDLHVHTNLSIGESRLEEMVECAKNLGLGAVGIVQYYPEISGLPSFPDIDVISCIMLKPKSAGELAALAEKVREKCEVLMVHGGDYDVNRAACENSMIDVLCHPELGRRDSGIDHVCAKAASDNDVAIEINFREILESSRKTRAYVISAIKRNVKLGLKYDFDIVTASGAVSKWGMRSGRELAAAANVLGLDLGYSIDTVSSVPIAIVSKNREKLSGARWHGVRVVG